MKTPEQATAIIKEYFTPEGWVTYWNSALVTELEERLFDDPALRYEFSSNLVLRVLKYRDRFMDRPVDADLVPAAIGKAVAQKLYKEIYAKEIYERAHADDPR